VIAIETLELTVGSLGDVGCCGTGPPSGTVGDGPLDGLGPPGEGPLEGLGPPGEGPLEGLGPEVVGGVGLLGGGVGLVVPLPGALGELPPGFGPDDAPGMDKPCVR
jgi:hypothetical protein